MPITSEQEQALNALLQNQQFLAAPPPQKFQTLRQHGFSEFDAASTINDIQGQLAQSTRGSVAFPQPSMLRRGFEALTGAGMRAAPSVIGEEIAGQTARIVPALRPFEVPLRAGGAMAGEAARQLFLAPPDEPIDPIEMLAAGAIPARGSAARGLRLSPRGALSRRRGRIRFARNVIPGAGAALLEQAREEIATIPRHLREGIDTAIEQRFPGENLGTLRAQSLVENPTLEIPAFRRAASRVSQGEETAGRFGAQLGGRPARIARTGGAQPNITLQELDVVRRNLGGLIGQARRAGNAATESQLRQMLAGFFEDLDVAVARGIPGAAEYKASLEGFRRAQAASDLENALERFSRPLRGENFASLNLPLLLRDLRRAFNPATAKTSRPRGFETLPDFLSASEKQDMLTLVDFWNQNLPSLPTRMGINAPNIGSGQALFRGGTAGAVAVGLNRLAGSTVIDPTLAALTTTAAAGLISNMMMSPSGRQLLRNFVERGGPVSFNELAARFLLQTARADLLSPQGLSQELLRGTPEVRPRIERIRR